MVAENNKENYLIHFVTLGRNGVNEIDMHVKIQLLLVGVEEEVGANLYLVQRAAIESKVPLVPPAVMVLEPFVVAAALEVFAAAALELLNFVVQMVGVEMIAMVNEAGVVVLVAGTLGMALTLGPLMAQ